MTDARATLEKRLVEVQEAVAAARAEAGRDDEITTIVVTKFHPESLVRDLYDLGVRDVGENRHQEAFAKAQLLSEYGDLEWHFVGQLQSKKARQARSYARSFHSLDRDSVIQALSSSDGVVDAFVQVNLTSDPARGGVPPAQILEWADRVAATPGLTLRGVMAVAPLDEEPRRAFERVRLLSEQVRAVYPEASAISAGMSHDFREAILEGATHLRIGSAITGMRPAAG